MLVLDFDGVIADAVLECAAVTWYARFPERAARTPKLSDAIAGVPSDFLQTFKGVRAFSRTLADFMVTHELFPDKRTVDSDAFQDAKRSTQTGRLDALAARAEAVRATWRREQFSEWVSLHRIFAPMSDMIKKTSHPIMIVSAKDSDSINAILHQNGLANRVIKIFGSCQDKHAVLTSIIAEIAEGGSTKETIFIDDSIDNVIAVKGLPIRALWASWGYHGSEDYARAAANDIQVIELKELSAISGLQ